MSGRDAVIDSIVAAFNEAHDGQAERMTVFATFDQDFTEGWPINDGNVLGRMLRKHTCVNKVEFGNKSFDLPS